MRRALALAALLVPSAAIARPGLIVPPALGRTDTVWIAGRALLERPRTDAAAPVNNVWALAAPNWEGAEVEVLFRGHRARVIAGRDGEFEVPIRADAGKPFPAGTHPVAVKIPGAVVRSVVHVLPPDAPFILVSDFDDTVAVTNVTSTRKLLATTFLEDARTHPAVRGMPEIYRCIAEASGAGALAFVSGSPVQLAPRVAAFLERNGFPPAALYLRNLGRGTLHGYKEPVLARLAERFSQPFVLVGDSGEKDPEIYAEFRRARPERVLAIYIRHAGNPGPASRYAGMLIFSDPVEVLADASARGIVAAEARPARCRPGEGLRR